MAKPNKYDVTVGRGKSKLGVASLYGDPNTIGSRDTAGSGGGGGLGEVRGALTQSQIDQKSPV